MRFAFFGFAAAACALAACSSKAASPDAGNPKIPGADAHVDLQPLACGSNDTARGPISWIDSNHGDDALGADGTARLRSEGGVAQLELLGSVREGTVSGVTWTVTATLTGGETLLAGTYACGQDAAAGYEVTNPADCWSSAPTADCPGRVTSCTFTLDEQIWPGCFAADARGTFSMTLGGTDAGVVTITGGSFDIPIVEPVPPS